jgi:hypothetical protein
MLKRQLGRNNSTPQKGSRSLYMHLEAAGELGSSLENSGAAVNRCGTPRSG